MDFQRPPKWERILKKTALYFAAFIAVTLTVGFIVQLHREVEFHNVGPPSGFFIKVDDHRIHLRLQGDGHFTFVLEAGLGDYSGVGVRWNQHWLRSAGSFSMIVPASVGVRKVLTQGRHGKLRWNCTESWRPPTFRSPIFS